LLLKSGKLLKVKLQGKINLKIRIFNSETLMPKQMDLTYNPDFRSTYKLDF
jgi:hypothetical protein